MHQSVLNLQCVPSYRGCLSSIAHTSPDPATGVAACAMSGRPGCTERDLDLMRATIVQHCDVLFVRW